MKIDREQNLIRQYLLGDLDERRRERLEGKILTDPKFRKRVLLIEDELFDDYVMGVLSDNERRKFDERLLATPGQVRKLEAVRVFRDYASGAAGGLPPLQHTPAHRLFAARWPSALTYENRGLIYATAALALIACVVLAAIMLGRQPPNPALDARGGRAALEEELTLLNDPRNSSTPIGQHPASPSSVLNVRLSPILVRGWREPPVVSIREDTEVVWFELGLMGGEYLSLEAVLRTVEGREMFTIRGLRAATAAAEQVVIYKVPARLLADGDYLLALRGASRDGQLKDMGEYYFRVTHEVR